jgi:hypothetical protein
MKRFLIILGFSLALQTNRAQTLSEMQKAFPAQDVVYTNVSFEMKISLDGDQLIAKSERTTDFMALTDNAGLYMSKQSVYHSGFNQLDDWSAYTITAEGKKIKVTDSKTASNSSDNIFYDDVKETSFNMPAISPGAMGQVKYKIRHTNPYLLSPFFFDHYFPVANAELVLSFPEEVSMKYIIKGLHKNEVNFTSETRKGRTTWRFSIKNYTGEKTYGDALDRDYWATHVIYYVEKFKKRDGSEQDFLADLKSLYRFNYNHIKELNKKEVPDLKKLTDSIVAGSKNDEEKARRIYRWVQDHIKYVAFEDGLEGFVPREASLVCTRRFGDCKDMSSLITMMLRQAGLQAYYTWIGTRDIPYDYTEVHLPIVDNHMISTLYLNGKYIFLDGTDPSCIFGVPSSGIQGKQAMLAINENESKIERVPVPEKMINRVQDTTFLEFSGTELRGRVNLHLHGYFATDMYNRLKYRNETDRDDFFKGRLARASNKINLSDFKVNTLPEKDHIQLSAKLVLPDYAKKLGDEYFLNVNLFKFFENQEIDFPKRKVPIDKDYLYTSTYVTVLTIPDGYQVSYLPESKTFKNDTWGFEIKYEVKNNRIIFSQKFDNDHLELYPDRFEAWNKVLENLYPLYKETVLLSKK